MAKQGKSWPEVELGDVVEKIANGTGLPQFDQQSNGMFPITRIETISFEEIDLSRVKYVNASTSDVEKYGLKFGDILFSHINSDKHLGKTAINKTTETIIHGINLLLIRTNHLCDSSYLNYYFKWYRLRGGFVEIAQRAVNQSSINQKKLKQIKVPLPPLPEQKLIVAKLDTLFAHLDQLRSRLDKIPVLLKQFRQAVLTQAVTGKLTGSRYELRPLHNFGLQIQTGPFGSALHKADYKSSGVPVINPSHINEGNIIPDISIRIGKSKLEQLKPWILNDGDVILGRRGEMGRAAKYNITTGQMVCGTGSLILRKSKFIEPDFLSLYLRSPFSIQFLEENSVGSTMVNLNQKIIRSLPFPSISSEEQTKIVHKVQSLFAVVNRIHESHQALNEKIDHMPIAILSKAFRGELVEEQIGKELKAYSQKAEDLLIAAEPEDSSKFLL